MFSFPSSKADSLVVVLAPLESATLLLPNDNKVVEKGRPAIFSCSVLPKRMAAVSYFSWNMEQENAVQTYQPHVTYAFQTPGRYRVSVAVTNGVSSIVSDSVVVLVSLEELKRWKILSPVPMT